MCEHGGFDTDIEAVGKALDALRRLLEDEVPGQVLLQRLCEWSVEAFAGAEMAEVTLPTGDEGSGRAACTDPRLASIGDAQIRTGEGPGHVAADTHTVLRGDVSGVAGRWPAFAAAAAASGLEKGSFLSAPLPAGGGAGWLNLFSGAENAFSEFDAVLLQVYATLIESTIRLTGDGREAREEVAGLTRAMESRSIIEQAKGIVMATGGVSAADAFDFLVVSSQKKNVKLALLAQEVVDLTTGADGHGAPGVTVPIAQ
ncbi:ANTAR domain-containing protein [Rhodococcus koreensis]|uniref:ANTAR domain-containing protein n=1 Tax=Rhodococcus koreensis TaxID=99653 RepID=UPI0036DACBBB